MNGKPLTKADIAKIKELRRTGHSLPEIIRIVKRGSSTVYYHAKSVTVLDPFKSILREKQGGSKIKAKLRWGESKYKAKGLIGTVDKRGCYFILASLYWGEGNKKDLNLINSDPTLIRVFLHCLQQVGVKKDRLRISLRIYENINADEAKVFWATVCGIEPKDILSVNILTGKKDGKLKYGMCRVRVTKGGSFFKLIMSMIEQIRLQTIPAPVVQWIERGTPKP